jgi:ATP-binding cassette subfamily F protein 3
MREALAEALSEFTGAIVLVSHDRHLIGLVSETYWRVADGEVIPFDGDLDEYAAWLRSRPNAGEGKAPTLKTAVAAPVPTPVAAPKPRTNPHKLQKAEARVAELERALGEIEHALAQPATYSDAATAAELGQRQSALRAELEQAEGELLALYEAA